MASINMKSLVVGALHPDYAGDPFHYILMQILMAARARGVQAIDGPFLQVRDVEAFKEVAKRSAVLGFDGKWVLHPGQVDAANEIYSPSQEDYDHAELILDAYDWATSEKGGKKGSAMLGDEMIDEASRKMALVIAGKGRAAGMERTSSFTPARGVTAAKRRGVRLNGAAGRVAASTTSQKTMSSTKSPVAIEPRMIPARARPSPCSPVRRICLRAEEPQEDARRAGRRRRSTSAAIASRVGRRRTVTAAVAGGYRLAGRVGRAGG